MSNRTNFANSLAEAQGLTKKGGDDLLVVVTSVIKNLLVNSEEVVFPGLGRVYTEVRSARRGHNPKTGAPIDIPAKQVVKFKAFPKALS